MSITGAVHRLPPLRTKPLDPNIILNTLRAAVITVDQNRVICHVNSAAEQFFAMGAHYLVGYSLDSVLPPDSQIFTLLALTQDRGVNVCEHGVVVDTPRTGRRVLSVTANVVTEAPDYVVLSLMEQSIAARMSALLPSRNAARSAAAMSAMLAHEVKNPLSGIRGAAQLLETGLGQDEQILTQLIIDETDRIVSLLERMDVFSAEYPLMTEDVNIHVILDHVIRVAENGFARHVRIRKGYDPSLPPIAGNRNMLIQVFLNLIKNAAEAVPQEGGEIIVSTAFLHGMRLTSPTVGESRNLPLAILIQDNGSGITPDLLPHLFDAFVTTKASGSGLGLALAAKIIDDHGGIIECDSQPRRTLFRVLFPMVSESEEKTTR